MNQKRKTKKEKRLASAFEGVVAGVGWYKAEQWSLLKLLAVDRQELEDTYEQWL